MAAKNSDRAVELIASAPDSHAEIAGKVGVDKSLVTRWNTRDRSPSDAQLAKLEDLYGGPLEARRARPKRKPARPSPAASPPDDDESNNDRLRRYIRDGMRELERDTELSGVKKAEILKKLVDAQVALDKSTGENALTTQKILAHPEFKRVADLIVGTISIYPDALAKVLEILRANQ